MKHIFMMIILTFVTLALSIDQSHQQEKVNEYFYSVYDNKENLDEYCANHTEYMMDIEIERTEVRFWLKNAGNSWSGTLSLHDESEKIEEIPVVVDGNEIVIQTIPEKRVSTDILFFKQFDTEKCTITESTTQVLFEPCLEEVLGEYPEDEIKLYMQRLYDEIISSLTLFDRKDDYFAAINELHGYAFNRYTGNPDKPCYKLSLGFTGNENVQWNPGFANFGDVSMLFSERCPIAW